MPPGAVDRLRATIDTPKHGYAPIRLYSSNDSEAAHHLVVFIGKNVAVPNPLTNLLEGGDDTRHGSGGNLRGVLPTILLRRGWLRLTSQWWRTAASFNFSALMP